MIGANDNGNFENDQRESQREGETEERERLQWLRECLSENQQALPAFEQNEFTRAMLVALYRMRGPLSRDKREHAKGRLASMRNATNTIHAEIERLDRILRILEVSPSPLQQEDSSRAAEMDELEAFTKLMTLLMEIAPSPTQPSSILAAIDRQVQMEERWQRMADRSEELCTRAQQLHTHLSSRLVPLLQRAQQDYEGGGLRECDLAIRQVGNAIPMLQMKREEYQERLSHMLRTEAPSTPSPSPSLALIQGEEGGTVSFARIMEKVEAILEEKRQLAEIEEQLQPYNRLPPDLSLARLEVERARGELQELLGQRDHLLHSLPTHQAIITTPTTLTSKTLPPSPSPSPSPSLLHQQFHR